MVNFYLFSFNYLLNLVGRAHFGLDAQDGGRGYGVSYDGYRLGLEAKVAFAIIGNLDIAPFTRCNRLTRIVRSRAPTTLLYASDNQGHIARIGKMECV